MHDIMFEIAGLWMTGLLGVSVILVIRAKTAMTRILALDTLTLILDRGPDSVRRR